MAAHYGPKYWKKDTMVNECKHLLKLFTATWPHMRPILGTKNLLPESANAAARDTHLPPDLWTTFKANVYDTESKLQLSRLKILAEIDSVLKAKGSVSTLTTCTDDEVRDALIHLCAKSQGTSIKKKVSCARQAFMAIGRKHEFCDRTEIRECPTGPVWANTGNPVSGALQETLIDRTAQDEKPDKQSLGGAARFPMMAQYNLEQLVRTCELVHKYQRSKGKGKNQAIKQIQNSCGLGQLILTLMNTGSRPGNVNLMLHEHLYFNGLHKKVYWLTLAFIKPATLAHLIRQDAITDYVMKVHNGYKKKGAEGRDELCEWNRQTIPHAYNSLDLPIMFAIYSRILLTVDPDSFRNPAVFLKPAQTYSEIFGRQNKKLGYTNLVLYSMRYGTAKDDEENATDLALTRKRMAHSERSTLAIDTYAACNKTVDGWSEDPDFDPDCYDPEDNPDTDNFYTAQEPQDCVDLTDPFAPVPLVFNRAWTTNTFKGHPDLQADFEEITDLVADFIEDPSDQVFETLCDRAANHNTLDTLKEIPLGIAYVIPGAKRNIDVATLADYFDLTEDATFVPHLNDFTELMYGDWRSLGPEPEPAKEPEVPEPKKKKKKVEVVLEDDIIVEGVAKPEQKKKISKKVKDLPEPKIEKTPEKTTTREQVAAPSAPARPKRDRNLPVRFR